MVAEVWKDILDYEGYYQASDWGQVQSLDREIVDSDGRQRLFRGRILKLQQHGTGHLIVGLSVASAVKIRLVHQLVLETFVGPCPPGCESCHNDGNPSNNYLTNLRWDTRSENIKDRFRHDQKPYQRCVKRSDGIVFLSVTEAARSVGGLQGNISNVCAGRNKSAKGYKWEYV